MADIKYRNVSNPNVSENLFYALSALEDYGFQDELTITGLTRDSKKNKSVGGASGSKHLHGDGMDISSRSDSTAFITWVKTPKGKKWSNDFSMKMIDETGKKGAPHYHFEASKPKVDVSKYKSAYNESKNKDGLVNIQKVKPMAKSQSTSQKEKVANKFFNGGYENNKKEVEYLKRKHGIGSKEYKDAKKELDAKVAYMVYAEQNRKEKSLQAGIDKAEKEGDWGLANKLTDQQESFNENKIDFGKTKLRPDQSTVWDEDGKARQMVQKLDLDFDAIYDKYETSTAAQKVKEEEDAPAEEEIVSDETTETKGGGGATTTDKTGDSDPIETRDEGGKEGGGSDVLEGGVKKDEKDYSGLAEKKRQEIEELKRIQADEIDIGEYAPDSQSDRDVMGSITDIGRGLIGMQGAMKEVPKYERGSMWNKAMDSADRRSEEGLTPDELNYRNQQTERAYAYDVKNIRRGAGGSSGAYLGNLGRAQGQLYDQFGQTAALDEGVRRQNRANFQAMAGKDEVINRQQFEDDLSQVLKTKETGGALVNEAIKNIEERKQYRKKYGKDSAKYAYDKALWKDMETNRLTGEKSARNEVSRDIAKREFELAKIEEKIGDKNVVDGDQNDALVNETQKKINANKEVTEIQEDTDVESSVLSTDNGKNLVKATTKDVPVELDAKGKAKTGGTVTTSASLSDEVSQESQDTRSLNSKNIDVKIKEKRAQMEATDDDDEMMRLDREIEELNKMRRKGVGVKANY